MGQLDGKVAIVTGSGRGIGREVALRLVRDGASVVVNDLDDEPVQETIALVEQLGGRAVACNGNVTAADFGERIVDTAVKRFGGVHVVVNNAGYTWDNVIQRMTDEQWYAIIAISRPGSRSPLPRARPAPSRSKAARCGSASKALGSPR